MIVLQYIADLINWLLIGWFCLSPVAAFYGHYKRMEQFRNEQRH